MCFLQKDSGACKANQTGVAHYVLSHRNEDNLLLLKVVCELAKVLVLLTMT